MVLYIDSFLSSAQKQKTIYQVLLWGIQVNSLGMAFTFPFTGYALFSIIFSTAFIFFTFGFAWVFIKDLLNNKPVKTILWLSLFAIGSLVVSSIGPFTLAYILATSSGNANLFRDAVYTYLHFQYNGFFTLSMFALLFHKKFQLAGEELKKKCWQFTVLICLSIAPALFLSLLWHNNSVIRVLAYLGCALTLLSLFSFARITILLKKELYFSIPIARLLLTFSLVSFAIKMLLQTGTVIPSLAHAVFGYRPIIIGFLHLVFLGMISFYIISVFVEENVFASINKLSRFAIIYFSTAIILNEFILLVNGIGLMFKKTHEIYPWLLWIAAILLFTGTVLMSIARWRCDKQVSFHPSR